ncbi:STAS domain-containing protein [Streptomyces canus]|uniref:STAS domain-containing protein n=1 Tax=Streptomyces canus TaxID=58343 RepID=UPI003719259A
MDHETSPPLSDELAIAVTSGVRCVEVDFSQVPFCDCSGLNALLRARERAQAAGVCFGVLGPVTPVVERLFGLTEVESALLRVA